MPQQHDLLEVEALSGDDAERQIGKFDLFTSVRTRLSILQPSEASFEMGDQETFEQLNEFVGLGALFRMTLNGRPLLRGRIETQEVPTDAMRSTEIRWVMRTLLADARYTSADPKIGVENRSIKEVIVEAFSRLGLVEADFVFRGDISRDLLTGKSTKGGAAPKDLDEIKLDQAKVRPPESIWDFADRHCRRHGLMMWDAPDGRIVIAAPDDNQEPLYHLRMLRPPESDYNNLLSATRIRDITEAASRLSVFGAGTTDSKGRIRFVLDDPVVQKLGFHREVLIMDEGVKTTERAERRARQERAQRARRIDSWQLIVQGLSYSDGDAEGIPYSPDTVVDLIVTTTGGAVGRYHVDAVEFVRDADASDTTVLTCVAPGTWVL